MFEITFFFLHPVLQIPSNLINISVRYISTKCVKVSKQHRNRVIFLKPPPSTSPLGHSKLRVVIPQHPHLLTRATHIIL